MSEIDETVEPEERDDIEAVKPKAKKATKKADTPQGLPHYVNSKRA